MNKIKEAFEPIKADSKMKSDVKEFLYMQEEKQSKPHRNYRRQIVIAICCLVVILGGFKGFQYNQVYAQNAYVKVSGPVQLGVTLNKKDRVIKLEGFNDCGKEVAEAVDVKHMTYEEALATIMESDTYEKYVSGESDVSIKVKSKDEECQNALQNQSENACHKYQKKHRYGNGSGNGNGQGNGSGNGNGNGQGNGKGCSSSEGGSHHQNGSEQ